MTAEQLNRAIKDFAMTLFFTLGIMMIVIWPAYINARLDAIAMAIQASAAHYPDSQLEGRQ